MVMEAFLDESGTHEGSAIVCVSAWVGARYQWKKFLSYWDGKYFHAKERKCNPLRQALFEAINFGELEGFTAWMHPQDYSYANDHMKSGLGNPYSLCTFACAMGVSKFCRTNDLGKVAFVVEDGQPNIEFVRSTLEYMMTKDRLGIASVAVAKKKDFVQLCTADFLAYSRSSDPEWSQAFANTGRVWEDQITHEKVFRMSRQITDGLKRKKRERRLLKTQNSESVAPKD